MGTKCAAFLVLSLLFTLSAQADTRTSAELAENKIVAASSSVMRGPCASQTSTLTIRSKEKVAIDIFGISFGVASRGVDQTLCLPLKKTVYVTFKDKNKRARSYHLTAQNHAARIRFKRHLVTSAKGIRVKRLYGKDAAEPLYTLEEPPYTPRTGPVPTYGTQREARYQHELIGRELKKELKLYRSFSEEQSTQKKKSDTKVRALLEERKRLSKIAFPRAIDTEAAPIKRHEYSALKSGVAKAIKRRQSAFMHCGENTKKKLSIVGTFQVDKRGKTKAVHLNNDTPSKCFENVLRRIRFPADARERSYPFSFVTRVSE